MNKKQFIQLLSKYRQGKATNEECKFIEAYYDLFEMEPGLEATMDKEKTEQLKARIKNEIWIRISRNESLSGKVRKLITRPASVAAAIIVILATSIVLYILENNKPVNTKTIVQNLEQQHKNFIQPGGNKAILTLANGQKVILDSSSAVVLAPQGVVNIHRLAGSGGLIYQSMPSSAFKAKEEEFNTITTPIGGEYKVTLSDGTKVRLNAGSSLRYPVAFTGKERRVSLSGEAYFEVKPLLQSGEAFKEETKVPFIVHINSLSGDGGEVKVLGTHFNINAYGDEKMVKTTLAEGAVKITKGSESRLLKPGEQASMNKETGDINVKRVDVDIALAWTNNLFHFENENIETIMRELARWYNLEIVYATKNMNNKNFSGIISRYSNADAVLKRLELTGTVHFKVEGRKIVVMD